MHSVTDDKVFSQPQPQPFPVPAYWCDYCEDMTTPKFGIVGYDREGAPIYGSDRCSQCGSEDDIRQCDICSRCSARWDEEHDCCPQCGNEWVAEC